MMRRQGLVLLGLVVVLLVVFVLFMPLFSGGQANTQPAPFLPAAVAPTCGVGLSGHDAGIWVEGIQAQQVCDAVVVAIKRSGEQPRAWNGRIPRGGDYYAVCADQLPDFAYEVVDTGFAIYGSSWCEWLVDVYGASTVIVEVDLFGIIKKGRP